MTRLEEILRHFDDLELLNLKKYKYDTYLPASRKCIDAEIDKRKLSMERTEALRQELKEKIVDDKRVRCPRCLSAKIAADTVEYWNTYQRRGIHDDLAVVDGIVGRKTTMEKLSCIVCGHVLHAPNVSGMDVLGKAASDFFSGLFKKKK